MTNDRDTFFKNIHFLVENSGREHKTSLKDFMDSVERNLILATLAKTGGSQIRASELLRVKKTTLNEKIKKHKICFHKRAV